MKIAEEKKLAGSGTAARLMGSAVCVLAACALAATPVFGQTTGVSMPDQSVITEAPAPQSQEYKPTKPSAAIPETSATTAPIVYGPYVPYHAPGTTAADTTAAFNPDASIVTESSMGRRPLSEANGNDADAGIVTSEPGGPNEIPVGAVVKVRLLGEISTLTTEPGSDFAAVISAPVMRDGQVLIPTGSVLRGRVTEVHGGRRISGTPAVHLQALTVTLPDGTVYPVHAQVIDTNSWDNTRVDNEGTILRKDHAGATLAMMSITTGGAMAAGAVVGGVPGALIGAGVGAGLSTVVWLKQNREAVLPKDLGITFSLTMPLNVTPANAHMTGMPTGE